MTDTTESVNYVARIRPEEGGWIVDFPDLEGCITEADTREEAIENTPDLLKRYCEAIRDTQRIAAEYGRSTSMCLPVPSEYLKSLTIEEPLKYLEITVKLDEY